MKKKTGLFLWSFLTITPACVAMEPADSSDEASPHMPLKRKAKAGDAQAQYELGMLYKKGVGDIVIVKKALKGLSYLEKAALQGHTGAQVECTNMYLGWTNEGIQKDDNKAIKYVTLAVKKDDKRAQSILGFMYISGTGIQKDLDEAEKWFTKAAAQGDSFSQHNLGMMLYEKKQYAEALKFFTLAANQKNTNSCQYLATMYRNGEGVPKNEQEALKWEQYAKNPNLMMEAADSSDETSKHIPLKKRAKSGEKQAQYKLGMWYKEGVGDIVKVKKPLKALIYLEKAALQDHTEAQVECARMYLDFDNENIPKNGEKAIKYITAAVKKDNARAQRILGFMYEEGHGIQKDECQSSFNPIFFLSYYTTKHVLQFPVSR